MSLKHENAKLQNIIKLMGTLSNSELLIVERFINSLLSGVENSGEKALPLIVENDKGIIGANNEMIGNQGETTPLWQAFQQISSDVPDEIWDEIPSDFSGNLDKYLYGRNLE